MQELLHKKKCLCKSNVLLKLVALTALDVDRIIVMVGDEHAEYPVDYSYIGQLSLNVFRIVFWTRGHKPRLASSFTQG
jgi:hypothetical protein